MNTKRFTRGLVATAVMLGLSTTALADHDRYQRSVSTSGYAYSKTSSGPVYDYAQVIRSEPIVRYVTVKRPERECWQETQYVTVERDVPGSGASRLVGAIIGGVIGHQFGSGRGNDAATIAGTMIGAAVGDQAARDKYGADSRVVEYERPVERCETRIVETQEERIDGYNVTYRYNGQKYRTRMPYNPGNRLRIRVDIRPAA